MSADLEDVWHLLLQAFQVLEASINTSTVNCVAQSPPGIKLLPNVYGTLMLVTCQLGIVQIRIQNIQMFAVEI